MSAYYATGGPAQRPSGRSPLTPVQVSFSGPAPQSRATVAFRLLLAVPHIVILLTMAVGAGVVAFIGWFGALFTGRLPVFAADFLTGYLRWLSRAQAYQYLLTDEYPPFTLDDQDYPVRIAVPPGQELNRAAVFFRFFLLIPAWIVQSVISYGALTLFQFANWLIVLIMGQMPDTIHQALSAVLRYNYRVLAFALMLTSTYPGGLFGDVDQPGPYGGYQAWPVAGRQWLLFLSASARKLMVFFIVFGAVLSAGYSAYRTVTVIANANKLVAAAQVTAATIPMRAALVDYPSQVTACDGKADCVTSLDRTMAAGFGNLASALQVISVPSQAATARDRLITASSNLAAAFTRMASVTSASKYAGMASSAGVEQAGEQFDVDYYYLMSALRS